MPKFRKRPVVITAVQWTGYNKTEIGAFCPDAAFDDDTTAVMIATDEGTMRGDPGDWIIRGVAGEFYPCKPDVFAATYVPVVEAAEDEVDQVSAP